MKKKLHFKSSIMIYLIISVMVISAMFPMQISATTPVEVPATTEVEASGTTAVEIPEGTEAEIPEGTEAGTSEMTAIETEATLAEAAEAASVEMSEATYSTSDVTVAYDPDDGVTRYENFYKTTVPVGGKVTNKPANPQRDGYFFLGWAHTFNGNGEPVLWDFANDTVSDNTTLWAVWEEGCVVAYDPDDGTAKYEDFYKTTVHVGDKVTDKPADPQRDGYFFLGWYYALDGNGEPILWDFANDTVPHNITLWAAWEEGCLVAYDPDDGVTKYEDFYKTTVHVGDKVTDKPADPIRSGYQFKGWYYALDANDNPILWDFANDTVPHNITLWAAWTVSTGGGGNGGGGNGGGGGGSCGTTTTEPGVEGSTGPEASTEPNIEVSTEPEASTEPDIEVATEEKPGTTTESKTEQSTEPGTNTGTGNGGRPDGSPLTGDERNILLWAVAGTAASGILILSVVRKKKEQE